MKKTKYITVFTASLLFSLSAIGADMVTYEWKGGVASFDDVTQSPYESWNNSGNWKTGPEETYPDDNLDKAYFWNTSDTTVGFDANTTVGYLASTSGFKNMIFDLRGKTLTLDGSNNGNLAIWAHTEPNVMTEDASGTFDNGTLAFKATSGSSAIVALGASQESTGKLGMNFGQDATLALQSHLVLTFRKDGEKYYDGNNGVTFNVLGTINGKPTGNTDYQSLFVRYQNGLNANATKFDDKVVTFNLGSSTVKTATADVLNFSQYEGTTANIYGEMTVNGKYYTEVKSQTYVTKGASATLNIENDGEMVLMNRSFDGAGVLTMNIKEGGKITATNNGLAIENTTAVVNGQIICDGVSANRNGFTIEDSHLTLSGANAKITYSTAGTGADGKKTGASMTRSTMIIENGAILSSGNGFGVLDNSTLKLNSANANSSEWLSIGSKSLIEINHSQATKSHFQITGKDAELAVNATFESTRNALFWLNSASIGEFTLSLGKDMEYLEIKSFFHNTTTTLEDRNVTMHIENFENDKIFFKYWAYFSNNDMMLATDVTDTELSYIDLGDKWKDLQIVEVVRDGETWYTLYATQIPEPAEWAGIFGVIALGFVMYRRRK